MRFIAVFDQIQTIRGIGFDSLIDASDFLFWGYEDNELTPHGIYDVLTSRVSLYDYAGRSVSTLGEATVRSFALDYIGHVHQYQLVAS